MKHTNLASRRVKGFPSLLAILMLVAACNNVTECKQDGSLQTAFNKLVCQNSPQTLGTDGTATLTFYCYWDWETSTQGVRPNGPVREIEVTFTSVGGTCTASGRTDSNGLVQCVFTAMNPATFEGGTVTATVKSYTRYSDGSERESLFDVTAVGEILPLNAEEPIVKDPIKKAEELKDNTYSVQKGSETAQVFPLPPEYSNWYTGTSYMDGTKQAIHVELMDEDPEQMTMGWFNGEIPPEVANKLTTINKEFYDKYPWAAAKMGTFRLGQDKTLDCHMGQGGNVKLDGSSQFWLKEKGGTKAYSGEYQFLFVFVFANQIYDPETDSYVSDGDEYTICGNATVKELVDDLSYFSLNYESNWVVPGKSVTLTANWTPGAQFDWSRVKLDSQSCGGRSGEWFTWDASTQKLYAKTSAENAQVELNFSYDGTDMTSSVTLFNGPGYSSFSLSMENSSADFILAENDPAYGWGSDTAWLTADEWTPQGTSFTGYGIEIDPETENYNKLSYNPYGLYVNFKKGIPTGDFNLIFRSVADHSAKFTIPVKVVEHKAISFQITYKHSNGVFEPWASGGENGTCNFPNGMELGVITNPEDAYWDWAHVELSPGYDSNFNFNGHGGSNEYAKLVPKTSHDSPVFGTQVIFRLKWDNRKKSEIYVNQN